MLWLAIRFPLLALEACPNPQPYHVVQEKNKVFLSSTQAKEYGIREGMKVASAHSLCDKLLVTQRDIQAEKVRLRNIAEQLLFITPAVSIEAPEIILLDILGSLKLFNGLPSLLEVLQQAINPLSQQWYCGIGHTPLCASLLSRQPITPNLSNVGSYTQQDFIHALSNIPIGELPLSTNLKQTLSAPGFRFLGDILSLPRTAIGKRQGKTFLLWLQKLLGETPDPRPPIEQPERFYTEAEFSDPVENVQGLLFPAQRLLSQLEFFLRQRQLSTKAIRWHLTDYRKQTQRLLIRRASDIPDISIWQDLTRRRFEQVQLHSATLKLGLDCARPRPLKQSSAGLFHTENERPDKLALLERLAALPALQISFAQHRDSHIPELAQDCQDPLATHRHTATAKDASLHATTKEDSRYLDEPIWLLEKPWPLHQQHDQLFWRGAALNILPGEQNLSSNWWAESVQRQYHVARHPLGLCCWIFRDKKNRWFLQGFF